MKSETWNGDVTVRIKDLFLWQIIVKQLFENRKKKKIVANNRHRSIYLIIGHYFLLLLSKLKNLMQPTHSDVKHFN